LTHCTDETCCKMLESLIRDHIMSCLLENDTTCTGWPKKMAQFFWYAVTSSNINRCVATLPCEMSSVFKATIENKKTSVTTNFK